MNMLQSTAAAAERVFEFLEEEELEVETVKIETDEVEKLNGSVTFNQVNFGYLPEKQLFMISICMFMLDKQSLLLVQQEQEKQRLLNC